MNVYVAHFSFGINPDAGPFDDGQCTAVVQAAHAAEAVEKFRAVLRDMKARHEAFELVERVYMDSCAEMATPPNDAVVTHMELSDPRGASLDVPVATDRSDLTIFSYGDEDDGDVVPFIEFE